jgi:hypothetical protein
MPSQQICIFIRKSKGDQRRDASDKPVITIHVAANPVLADLLDYYTEQRAAFCNKFYNTPPQKRHVRHQAMVNPGLNQQHVNHVRRKKSGEIRVEPAQK